MGIQDMNALKELEDRLLGGIHVESSIIGHISIDSFL